MLNEFHKPSDSNKPHMFLDVDGVINLAKNSYPGLETETVTIKCASTVCDEDHFYSLYWRTTVLKQLRELQKHVEIVWLTTWREDAVKILDPLWKLESKGFLQWEQKLSDYSQSFKSVALEEWALENSNTPIIWIDDVAIYANSRIYETFKKREDVLMIMPNSQYGLQNRDFEEVQKFLEKIK